MRSTAATLALPADAGGARLRGPERGGGQRGAAVFPASEVTDSSVVFENAEHDFPQRIGYRRVGGDSLVAWIEGTAGGKARRVEFPYRRAACPGR